MTTSRSGTVQSQRQSVLIGPNISKGFDRCCPLVVEMVNNNVLDEEDDVGSLVDFVTDDEDIMEVDKSPLRS